MADEATETTAVTPAKEEQQKNLSVEIAKLFSFNQTDKAILKISLWNGKVGFDFSKMINGAQKRSFITIDYEKAIYLSGVINGILRERLSAFKNGGTYKNYDIAIDQSFPDKDSGELRKNGILKIRTIIVKQETTGKDIPRVAISYESMGEVYDVVLCSRIISKQVSDKYIEKEIDPDDVRFIYLCKTWEGIVNNLPVIGYLTRIAELILGGKPFASNKPAYNNNSSGKKWGNYTGDNVRQFKGQNGEQRKSIANDDAVIDF
jgi:hypothetical protein